MPLIDVQSLIQLLRSDSALGLDWLDISENLLSEHVVELLGKFILQRTSLKHLRVCSCQIKVGFFVSWPSMMHIRSLNSFLFFELLDIAQAHALFCLKLMETTSQL